MGFLSARKTGANMFAIKKMCKNVTLICANSDDLSHWRNFALVRAQNSVYYQRQTPNSSDAANYFAAKGAKFSQKDAFFKGREFAKNSAQIGDLAEFALLNLSQNLVILIDERMLNPSGAKARDLRWNLAGASGAFVSRALNSISKTCGVKLNLAAETYNLAHDLELNSAKGSFGVLVIWALNSANNTSLDFITDWRWKQSGRANSAIGVRDLGLNLAKFGAFAIRGLNSVSASRAFAMLVLNSAKSASEVFVIRASNLTSKTCNLWLNSAKVA